MIPLQYQALAAVVIAAGGALAGWQARGWREDAARLADERDAHANYIRIATAYGAALDDANDQAATDRAQADADRRTFDKELRHAKRQGTRLVVCGPGLDTARPDDPGLPVRFDPYFVRLWNDALKIGLPTALRAPGRD